MRNGKNCVKETADKAAKYFGVPLLTVFENPVFYATKPRVGEIDIPAYLDNRQIPVFLDALNEVDVENSIRVALILMLMLGLRSGDEDCKHKTKKYCEILVNISLHIKSIAFVFNDERCAFYMLLNYVITLPQNLQTSTGFQYGYLGKQKPFQPTHLLYPSA